MISLLLPSSSSLPLLSSLFCDLSKLYLFPICNLKVTETQTSSAYQKGRFIISTPGHLSNPRHCEMQNCISLKSNWDQPSVTFSTFFFFLFYLWSFMPILLSSLFSSNWLSPSLESMSLLYPWLPYVSRTSEGSNRRLFSLSGPRDQSLRKSLICPDFSARVMVML